MGKQNYTEAKEKEERVWMCPKCHQAIGIENYPAISRDDNETEICSDCGLVEALAKVVR